MINSIRLTRFKQFKDTEFELRPFGVLMGENNSGKTTVLQAIWLALSSLHQGKLLTIDRKNLQIKVSSTGYYMFDFPFVPQGDLNSLFYNKISREGSTYDETSGTILEVVDERGNSFRLHLRELFKNLNVKLLTPAQELERPQLQKYAPLYISGFSGLNFQEERMFPATIETKIAAGDVQSIVRNIVLDLRQHAPEKYRYLEKIMKEEFDFRIKEVHYYGEDELFVFSEYEESKKEGNLGLEFSSCGSGIMQILQIIAVILRNCPEKTKVVLIDEPDAHLHEGLQVKFVNILMRMQQELGIQMILSTHSAAVIRSVEPEDVIPVLSDAAVNKGLSCSEDLQEVIEAHLNTYELGRAKISGKLAFFENVGMDVLERMAQVLHIDVFSGVNTIPVIRGWDHKDSFPFALNPVLDEVLDRKIEMHVVCNCDELPADEAERLRELAEMNEVKLHLVSKRAIEACLIRKPTIEAGESTKPESEAEESIKLENEAGESIKLENEAGESIKLENEAEESVKLENEAGISENKIPRTGKERRNALRNLRAEDICEEEKKLLESLKADVNVFEIPVMKAKKPVVRKTEFEQLTLLDI